MDPTWQEFLNLLKKSAFNSDYIRKGIQEALTRHALQKKPSLMDKEVKMKDYQIEGFNWLRILYLHGYHGILADEMGLGKTIQTIAFLCCLMESKVMGPFLICAPVTTLANWKAEFEKFAPKVKVLIYHGPLEKRLLLRKYLLPGQDGFEFPVIITAHKYVTMEIGVLKKINWKVITVDEGHVLKNINTEIFQGISDYSTNMFILLTGTPFQNNMQEVWTLLHLIVPSLITDACNIKNLSYVGGDCPDEAIVEKFRQILEPYILRRTKKDVNLNLQPKKEVTVYIPITVFQSKMLNNINSKYYKNVGGLGHDGNSSAMKVEMGIQPKRRKLSASPSIESDCPNQMQENLMKGLSYGNCHKVKSYAFKSGLQLGIDCLQHPYLVEMPVDKNGCFLASNKVFVECSGKMLVLKEMLLYFTHIGEKVLIFSTRTLMLNLIEELVQMLHIGYCRFDGSNSTEERSEEVKQFDKDPRKVVFLLSSRAGGLGINLTAANNVVIYNCAWNPQIDLQCQDRCHRIGQSKPVVIYKLVAKDTPDEYVSDKAQSKRNLEAMVLQQGRFTFKEKLVNPGDQLPLEVKHHNRPVYDLSGQLDNLKKAVRDMMIDSRVFDELTLDSS